MSCRDFFFPSSLCPKGVNANVEINNMMDGNPTNEFDGYKCNNFDDATSDATSEKNFF